MLPGATDIGGHTIGALVGFPAVRDELAHSRKQWMFIAAAVALTVPSGLMRFGVFGTVHNADPVETLLFGLAILGAAFLVSWAAEVAQMDISQGLAIAFLAFIAVLPEYAVDLVFSWKAGLQDRTGLVSCSSTTRCRELAVANMTGANRLLIGVGWAAVVLIWYFRSGNKSVTLPGSRRTDLGFLFLATVWALKIVILNHIDLFDSAVFGGMFVLYILHAGKEAHEEPELIGPPVAIAALPVTTRRAVTILLFLFAAAMILSSAEPFAQGLVTTAHRFNISEFLAVQWIAPLASEAPEMIIAILFVLRARPEQGLGTLVSSKVNQWTLLVGTVPFVYAIAHRSFAPMVMDARQVEEVMLTAAQSLFAISVLANLTISRGEAAGLLVLFLAQFGFENQAIRYGFAAVYIALFLALIVTHRPNREGLFHAIRHTFTRPGGSHLRV
jgi:cation:H+ antiporter